MKGRIGLKIAGMIGVLSLISGIGCSNPPIEVDGNAREADSCNPAQAGLSDAALYTPPEFTPPAGCDLSTIDLDPTLRRRTVVVIASASDWATVCKDALATDFDFSEQHLLLVQVPDSVSRPRWMVQKDGVLTIGEQNTSSCGSGQVPHPVRYTLVVPAAETITFFTCDSTGCGSDVP